MATDERLPAAGARPKTSLARVRAILTVPGRLFRLTVGAARYVVAHVQRFWLRWVRLAAAYRLLGKELRDSRRYQVRFPWLYARLDKVSRRLATLGVPSAEVRAGGSNRLTGALRAAIARLRAAAQAMLLHQRRRALFRRIAQAAFMIDQETCGPEAMTREIRFCLDRLDQLDEEIERLSRPAPGKRLSPKRLAWTVLAILAACALLLLWWQSPLEGGY